MRNAVFSEERTATKAVFSEEQTATKAPHYGFVYRRVLFYLEMVGKMWQRVVDSFDVVGCNYLLQV